MDRFGRQLSGCHGVTGSTHVACAPVPTNSFHSARVRSRFAWWHAAAMRSFVAIDQSVLATVEDVPCDAAATWSSDIATRDRPVVSGRLPVTLRNDSSRAPVLAV